jgi:autotransporter family porin
VSAQTASSADRTARAKSATRPPRAKARRDVVAARLVNNSRWEPRPRNRRFNQHVPSRRAIRHFRRWSDLPRRYKRRVTGNYRGTTDEILQWGAYKWGFAPDVFRAVAVMESWWRQRAIGDEGRSFGLMQLKRGHHCCYPLTRRSTAFNVDYYGSWLRWVYDGRARWLNHEERGGRYEAGELWRSVGAWYSGRWRQDNGDYIARVKRIVRKRIWHRRGFRAGG